MRCQRSGTRSAMNHARGYASTAEITVTTTVISSELISPSTKYGLAKNAA